MLRNARRCRPTLSANFLNEVLSLNAQEFKIGDKAKICGWLLNEVLSLNAQEYFVHAAERAFDGLLNEVLSLNAQE